ncbi:response regulator transcription factor [Caulobacter soli]|uniref:response regulator transcription factor n=1 Tax=Caulobacter soli TaxID=2708539 RepID=UPI0013EBE328|nr:response regulator transcription factor [Caulobacter soli]
MKVLLIEDELELASALCAALERHGLVVDHVGSLADAEEAAQSGDHDAVLLDRALPDGEGLGLIPILRLRRPGVPIIVLTARGEMSDRVAGLDLGADDYLAKPFAVEELLARVRAVRRRPVTMITEPVRLGRLQYDLTNDEAQVGDRRLDLPRRELRVLVTLMRRRGRTVLRSALEDAVYGFDDDIQSNTLDAHISRLRRKLVEASAGVEIHAIRGVGYLIRAAP